ncbi:hypothetical protein Cob_v008619 [Colletotrichum orbiculare MAFF 240422]|uniref:Uncharacterized protein n=1 Tax=Colletotrichum orbiculare (strain 104-T / ATCC 96160 / CBS 514.97 / LARS 414 / MAFF 240422) TaxID=1213857 RepID=N4V126_COLOR|nr:hypothetical protein Cob_v008619 [Colletotrichum orbiculare MAFF 240422]
MKVRGKRHCWECRRRCLVCDFTEPACKRCSASGVDCPGYGDAKPVRYKWLAPGATTSRGGRRNGTKYSTARDGRKRTADETAFATVVANARVFRWEAGAETCVLPQAAEYFNSCIHRDLLPIHELGHNSHIYPLTKNHVSVGATAPDYLKFGMVCVTLSHRLNKTRGDGQAQRALAERFYRYWGLAVGSLGQHLEMEDERTGDVVIAGILTLLLADIQNGTSLNWRWHIEGVHKIISLRGGFRETAASRSSLEPLLLVLWSIAVLGNTTCPASDLLATASHVDALDLILARCAAEVTPFHMCPLPLLAEIIRVNHLRSQAFEGTSAADHVSRQACDALDRIEAFSPESWSLAKPRPTASSRDDWTTVGHIYKSAVAVYTILSLQSLSVLPVTAGLRARSAAHGRALQRLLVEALPSARTKRFMIWPLVVLGAGAVHGGRRPRDFVARWLPVLSFELGTSVPLTARLVLERFWASGRTGWDECFERAYIFTGQVAVDTSRLLPYDVDGQRSSDDRC